MQTSNLKLGHFSKCMVVALLLSGVGIASAADCARSPTQAATHFLDASLKDGHRVARLLDTHSLERLRGRIQQIFDDRFSPDSAGFRQRLLGSDWPPEKLLSSPDVEYVGEYFARAGKHRTAARISNIHIVNVESVQYLGEKVTVTYDVTDASGRTGQQRDFYANQSAGCWRLLASDELWARIDYVTRMLKESRGPTPAKVGPSKLSLRVASASDFQRPGMSPTPLRVPNGRSSQVWVSDDSLLTEADLLGTSADWDCEAGLGAEDPAIRLEFLPGSSSKLQEWSEGHIGSMLAIVVDGKVFTYARVGGRLGSKLSMCLTGATLADAEAVSVALGGAAR